MAQGRSRAEGRRREGTGGFRRALIAIARAVHGEVNDDGRPRGSAVRLSDHVLRALGASRDHQRIFQPFEMLCVAGGQKLVAAFR